MRRANWAPTSTTSIGSRVPVALMVVTRSPCLTVAVVSVREWPFRECQVQPRTAATTPRKHKAKTGRPSKRRISPVVADRGDEGDAELGQRIRDDFICR